MDGKYIPLISLLNLKVGYEWQPMTDEDWEWVNHGTLPKSVDIPVKTNYNQHTYTFKEIK